MIIEETTEQFIKRNMQEVEEFIQQIKKKYNSNTIEEVIQKQEEILNKKTKEKTVKNSL